MKMQQQYKT